MLQWYALRSPSRTDGARVTAAVDRYVAFLLAHFRSVGVRSIAVVDGMVGLTVADLVSYGSTTAAALHVPATPPPRAVKREPCNRALALLCPMFLHRYISFSRTLNEHSAKVTERPFFVFVSFGCTSL